MILKKRKQISVREALRQEHERFGRESGKTLGSCGLCLRGRFRFYTHSSETWTCSVPSMSGHKQPCLSVACPLGCDKVSQQLESPVWAWYICFFVLFWVKNHLLLNVMWHPHCPEPSLPYRAAKNELFPCFFHVYCFYRYAVCHVSSVSHKVNVWES